MFITDSGMAVVLASHRRRMVEVSKYRRVLMSWERVYPPGEILAVDAEFATDLLLPDEVRDEKEK